MRSAATKTSIAASDLPTAMRMGWWQRHAGRVWLAARVVVVLAIAAAGAWWFLLAPVAVTTHTVATGTVDAEVLGTGTLEARVGATVGPKMAGLITRVTPD